jgi:hypothetical protein
VLVGSKVGLGSDPARLLHAVRSIIEAIRMMRNNNLRIGVTEYGWIKKLIFSAEFAKRYSSFLI